jgi:cytochrome c-type biogenesis protein CcmF
MQKISIGPPFYHKLIIPFLIPFLLAMTISLKLKWIKSDLQNKTSLFVFFVISIFLSVFIIKNLNVDFLINTALLASAFYLFLITLKDFFIKKIKNLSQTLSHFGFSLLIISILLNNFFTTEVITNLKIGESFKTKDLKITFEDIDQKEESNFKKIIGKFKVESTDEFVEVLNPELRIYNQPNIVTSEADIKTSLFSDKFITMNIVQNQEYFNIRYQFKPLMIWIWFSVLLISFGGLISLFKKRNEI